MSGPPSGRPPARVGSITIDLPTRARLLRRVDEALAGVDDPVVVTSVNLDHIHHFQARPPLPSGRTGPAEWLAVLDGWPVARAVRRAAPGVSVDLLAGSDLLLPCLEAAATRHCRIGLVGADDVTRTEFERQLPQRLPGIRSVDTWRVDWTDLDRPGWSLDLARQVRDRAISLLLVSLGKPRQERWLAEHVATTGARVALPFGSAVSYLVGTEQRPPALFRRHRLEWAYRLVREPVRLGPRYLVHGPAALRVLRRDLEMG
jgi:N-acetylglucosaminyldiphosphoundecaprenol N-acetyl-beta-D-mannosaminyltransferase